MKMKYLFLSFFIVVSGVCFAQGKTKNYRFHSVNSIGLVNGSNAVSATMQSVNGFQRGPLFAGIGVGLDYYLYRTVPVFADLRYEWGKKKDKFFVYADGGLNISWVQNYFNVVFFTSEGTNSNEFRNGLYGEAGIGYMLLMKKAGALVFAIGNSYKGLKELNHYSDWRADGLQTSINRYHLNRIVLKAGWKF